MPEINILVFDNASGRRIPGDHTLADVDRLTPDQWAWVDIGGEIDGDTQQFLEIAQQIPALAIQDAKRPRHPPKLEVLDNHIFLLLREIGDGGAGEDPVVSQLSLFVSDRVLITCHAGESAAVGRLLEHKDELPAKLSPAHLMYLVCRRIADACVPIVLAHEEQLAEIEDSLFLVTDETSIELLTRLNRQLRRLRRTLAYQSRIFDQLKADLRQLPARLDKHQVNDLHENNDRLSTLCQLNQELAVDLLNTHISIVSHRLNVVMRVLTVATIVFLPLGLLAGIYGMNFQLMPELSWEYGYFAVLGAMGVIAAALTIFFRLKRWL